MGGGTEGEREIGREKCRYWGCQLSGVIECSSLLLCGVRMKTCRCCVDCRSV